jgi:MFS family permease
MPRKSAVNDCSVLATLGAVLTYLAVFGIVLGINLLPAFGPPTWLVLVVLHVSWKVNVVALVIVGVLAASLGRFLLASSAKWLKPHLPRRYVAGVERAGSALLERRGRATAAVGLFLISPLPSAQLFIAAGLLELPLVFVTMAFGLGRLVTYSLYLTAASVAVTSLSGAFGDFFGSPWSIALEVILVLATVVGPLLLGRSRDS